MASNNHQKWFEKNPKKTILIIVLLTLFIGTLISEQLLALRNRNTFINPNFFVRYITLRESPPFMADYFFPHPELRRNQDSLVIKKYKFRIDQNGFIMPSEKYAHPDLSIVFLGSSTTECMFVDEDKRFPYLVGCLLEKECHLKINSYNGGLSGNNSLHSLDILLNKVLPLNPKIVVMMENINDLSVLLYEKSYWNNNPYKRIIVTEDHGTLNLLRIFVKKFIPNLYRELLQFVNIRKLVKTAEYGDEFKDIRGKKIIIDKAKVITDFGENLELFISICKIKKINPVLMTMASRITDNPDELIVRIFKKLNEVGLSYAEYKAMFDAFNDVIRQKAKENNITLIDLANDIPPTREYMYDTTHFNDQGSQKAAAIIAVHLKPLIAKCTDNPSRN